ncbi:HNH endonuclease [Prosthecochloris sp. N3]|uniref:HNH endonuclease n=1 Tax=Prosthecochloris ethylica TaxID=2743976 RepID=A0ABR9XRI8_9CHLB|nr:MULTISPECIES: HNH endonuclease [Prosthecochloris]MEC9486973.1 HNH endonuclease [Prosthecochloris sp.]MBF0586324.1 HNH endonuclease [Prosthecochloris ethylica]MBF0636458.1 HNH endonuclease [Prosthecochloris ethylica]NUK47632.1 HNH endonuclease [Prosthecochloris ethylica]RNA64134.1 HNH endonuclease [Prosthecochloris sp. ZM_2]
MPLQNAKVLLLNSSYEPLSICDAQKAILLLFGGKAVAVAHHPDRFICTVTESFPLPSIVRLTFFVRVPYKKLMLNRKNIFRRDNFQCQYCGRRDRQLTIDHVVPRSKGGDDTWENLLTACSVCNSKKGDRTPQEAGMPPINEPFRPTHIMLMRKFITTISEDWKPYLYMTR